MRATSTGSHDSPRALAASTPRRPARYRHDPWPTLGPSCHDTALGCTRGERLGLPNAPMLARFAASGKDWSLHTSRPGSICEFGCKAFTVCRMTEGCLALPPRSSPVAGPGELPRCAVNAKDKASKAQLFDPFWATKHLRAQFWLARRCHKVPRSSSTKLPITLASSRPRSTSSV